MGVHEYHRLLGDMGANPTLVMPIYVYVYIYIYILYIGVLMRVYISTIISSVIWAPVKGWWCLYLYKYIYRYIHIYLYVYIYIYTYVYIHVYIYIHMYTNRYHLTGIGTHIAEKTINAHVRTPLCIYVFTYLCVL